MSYCSLEEAYGTDFYRQVNNNHNLDVSYQSQQNPSRNTMYLPGARHDSDLSRVKHAKNSKNDAVSQSRNDLMVHRESFNSVSGNRRYEAPPYPTDMSAPQPSSDKIMKAWGEIEPMSINYDKSYPSPDKISPREHLKKSLLSDRGYRGESSSDESKDVFEPRGYLRSAKNYRTIKHDACQDYFYHLDTCRKCQAKLKKRVIRYFRALEKQRQNKSLLPGTHDMALNVDRELFTDEEFDVGEPEKKDFPKEIFKEKPVKQTIENFSLENQGNFQPLFLIFFGLFIIYMLDNSRRILR